MLRSLLPREEAQRHIAVELRDESSVSDTHIIINYIMEGDLVDNPENMVGFVVLRKNVPDFGVIVQFIGAPLQVI